MKQNWAICKGRNRRGVSLMEILLVVIILGFLGLGLTALYLTANRYLIQDSAIVLSQGMRPSPRIRSSVRWWWPTGWFS